MVYIYDADDWERELKKVRRGRQCTGGRAHEPPAEAEVTRWADAVWGAL